MKAYNDIILLYTYSTHSLCVFPSPVLISASPSFPHASLIQEDVAHEKARGAGDV